MEESVEQYLEKTVRFVQTMKSMPKDFMYICLEEYVLKHGRRMNPTKRPDDVPQMEMKACFANAMQLAQERDYTYCEGYAISIIPLYHAWCLDNEGNVIDPTWVDAIDYFGVEIPLQTALEVILQQECYGVLDSWTIGFPFLKGDIVL